MSKKFTEETFPFDEQTIVFKVAGKIFCLGNVASFESVNLKCEPNKATDLRAQYDQITPGYHMNKTHWNTVKLELLSLDFIKELIDHSYYMVYKSIPKKVRIELENEI